MVDTAIGIKYIYMAESCDEEHCSKNNLYLVE